jgi:hypothetical protein
MSTFKIPYRPGNEPTQDETKFAPKVKAKQADTSFLPNDLDQFDSTIYNLKLFMIPEADILTRQFDTENRVIIAETGVTTQIVIDDLEIKSFIAPGRKQKNQEAFNFNFTLREYYGAGLIDKIFIASTELGIKNYMDAPYFLELTFAGRDVDSSSPDIESNALRWLWPIRITKIETEVDASGAKYDVEASIFGNVGQWDINGSIPQGITVRGTTVGEAIANLQAQLNVASKQQSVTNATIPDLFSIKVAKSLGDLLLTESKHNNASAKTSGSNADGEDRKIREIALDKHLNIGEAINRIISVAPGYQAESKNTTTASDAEPNDAEKTKKIHRIFPSVEINSFDYGRGQYSKTYIYDVLPYEMTNLQVAPTEQAVSGSKKYREANSKGLIRKKYDYIYTGVNDQVLDFDLKFNFGWYVNIPSQAGIATKMTGAEEGQHITNVYREYRRIREEIIKARGLVADAPFGAGSVANSETDRIQAEINNSGLSDEEQAQLERLLESAVSSRLTGFEASSYNERYAKQQNTSSGVLQDVPRSTAPSSRFVSDYTVSRESLATAYKKYPLAYLENRRDQTDSAYSRSVEGNKGAGQPYVNSLFEQAFGSGGDLVNIELEVKGDPYWLESKEGIEAKGVVDTRPGQVNFVFVVQTADLPSEVTGLVEHTNSPLSGVYGVREIDHSFSNGKFTQKLYAYRDPQILIDDITEDIS